MPNLTIKKIPDGLYDQLRERARRNRRSMNSEVIHLLEESLGTRPVEADQLLVRAHRVRERTNVPYLTDEDLRRAREEGRA